MDSWRQFWALTRAERGLLLRAMTLLAVTSLVVRVAGFRRWQAMLTRLLPVAPRLFTPLCETPQKRALLTARMVRAAERHGWGRPNCLKQSLVLWWLLQRQGIPAELRVGVRKSAQALEAHAWVECEGVPLNEEQDLHAQYAPFDEALAATSPGAGTPPR